MTSPTQLTRLFAQALLLAALQLGIATPLLAAQTHHKKPAAAVPATPEPVPVAPQPVAPPNMLDQPAEPATVTERGNVLTVKADNSSLTQILHQVSSATGMQLDGLGGDERVFGSFGPGAPREVLTALLNGTAYNVMMVGNLPNGAPRQLLLMRKTGSGTSAPAAAQPRSSDEDASSDDTGTADDPDSAPPPPPPTAPVNQPTESPQPNPPGRTPQQILQQMQQQRNQQNGAPPQE